MHDPEALLAETGWLRALARRLVGSDDADDLAQDTLVAALQQTPPAREGLRPWLASVARRLSALMRRRRERRRRREGDASVPEPLPSAAEIVERAALQRTVVEAVLALTEPYRSTLLLHFWEGLSARQLAEHLGVPVETVRTRLKRGLATLRARLDSDAGGRAAWLLPMCAFGRVDAASGVAAAVVGGWIVGTQTKVVLAATVLAAAMLGVWQFWPVTSADSSQSEAHGTTPAVAAVIATKAHTETEPATSAPAREVVAPDPRTAGDRPWVVRGSVVRGHTTPFARAPILVELFEGYEAIGKPVLREELIADADGHFDWPLAMPVGTVTVRAGTTVERAAQSPQTVLVAAGRAAPQDLKLQCFPFDARVRGRVVGLDRRPLAGASVNAEFAFPQRSSCDAEGRFELAFSSEMNVRITAAAPGHAAEGKRVLSSEPGGTVDVEIALPAGVVIHGRVVDDQGAAVEGARVSSMFTQMLPELLSGSDGTFALAHNAMGLSGYALMAEKEEWLHAMTIVDGRNLKERYELVLRRGARIEGRVFDASSRPVAAASLCLTPPSNWTNSGPLRTTSRDDGSFVFPCVWLGTHMLGTDADGHAIDLRRIEAPTPGLATRVEVVLQPEQRVGGRVVDEREQPIAGARVIVRTANTPDDENGFHHFAPNTLTDATGRFELPRIGGPFVDVSCSSPNFETHLARGLGVGRTDHVITLRRSAGLAGRVVDARSGAPIPRFKIRLLRDRAGIVILEGFGGDRRDPGGRFHLKELVVADSDYVVEVAAAGYGRVTRRMQSKVDPDPDVEVFALLPGQVVRGVVITAHDGTPIPGARVSVRDPESPHPSRQPEIDATTDAEGRFALRDVAIGRFELAVQHPQWPRLRDGPFTVEEGVATERTIRMKPGASLRGIAVGADARPLAGATIYLRSDWRTWGKQDRREAKSDAEGRFRFESLDAGRHDVHAVAELGDAGTLVALGEAETVLGEEREVRLAPMGSARLRVELRVATGDLPKTCEAVATALQDNGQLIAGRASIQFLIRDGRATLVGLPAGRYSVEAYTGLMFAAARCEVGGRDPVHVELLLKPPR